MGAFIECSSRGKAIKLNDLWSMYSATLMRFEVEYKSTGFYNKLQLESPDLKKYHHGHGSAIYVTLERNINKEMFEPENSEEEYKVSEIFVFSIAIFVKRCCPIPITLTHSQGSPEQN